MSERLIIKNFGPIRDADIEVKDLTVFVGPQATGKSMAAQLMYFLRGPEQLLPQFLSRNIPRSSPTSKDKGDETQEPFLSAVLSALEWWLGNSVTKYTKKRDSSTTFFSGSSDQAEELTLDWSTQQTKFSSDYKKRVAEIFEGSDFPGVPQVYIPAGRALYSFLPPSSAIALLSPRLERSRWPGYIVNFYQTLGEAINWNFGGKKPDPFFGKEMRPFIQHGIKEVLEGEIVYGPETVQLKTRGTTLKSDTIAAGQMEAWPFFTIIEQATLNGYIDELRIYFDEPEAHLHPGAQVKIMEIIAYLVCHRTQFVITTHSPYILYALNNFLMASKVIKQGQTLPKDISEEVALDPFQVSAYRFSPRGKVQNIMDHKTGLIDETELDQVANDLGATFTRLQKKLLGID